MDPSQDSGEHTPTPDATVTLRGLVVQTGRGAGACQPLRAPVTLVGRAEACDVRVDAQSVRPLHCLLAPGPDGVALRTLHADGTRVNGRPTSAAVLRDGDLLEVGPTQFRVRWPAADDAGGPPHAQALRIQAAAVAAQQAGLFEHELKLADREAALARQETQLADHLEGKRRQLLDLQDQITDARAALREKRATHAALAEQQRAELAAAREETTDLQRDARAERQRLTTLRKRMIQRWKRHWSAERRATKAAAAELDRGWARLGAEKEAFAAEVARFNTDAELEKRRLRDEARELADAAKDWQARHTEESRALADESRALARRSKAVAAEERRLATDKAKVDRDLADRRREFEYLETRIGNARWKLLEHQQDLLKLAAPPPAAPPSETVTAPVDDAPADLREREAILERRGQTLARVAAELADQRLLLAEQAQRIVTAQEEWFAERDAAVREMADLGTQFQEQEQELALRAHAVETAEGRVRAERLELGQMRLRLEAERVRGEAHVSGHRSELHARAADLEAREQALGRLRANYADLFRRWGQRRTREVAALRAAHAACVQERAEWAAARFVWLRAGARAQEDRQAVAAQALALDELRKQMLAAIDRPAAARRVERLKRRWSAYCAGVARDLNRLRATLAAEAARLDGQAQRADDETRALAERAAEVEAVRAGLERERAEVEDWRVQWEHAVAQAEARHERAEKRADELRDEVERLARLLIDDGESAVTARAA